MVKDIWHDFIIILIITIIGAWEVPWVAAPFVDAVLDYGESYSSTLFDGLAAVNLPLVTKFTSCDAQCDSMPLARNITMMTVQGLFPKTVSSTGVTQF